MAIKIPSNEIKWETIKNETGDMFIVTSNKERTMYYIYSVVDDKLEKLGKAKNTVFPQVFAQTVLQDFVFQFSILKSKLIPSLPRVEYVIPRARALQTPGTRICSVNTERLYAQSLKKQRSRAGLRRE